MAYYHVCPNCGSNLDPGETCNCQDRRQEEQEKNICMKGGEKHESYFVAAGRESYLGTEIELSERDSAKASAERKLERIISRDGDAGGARREPWYLAQLIAEAVKASRFTKFTMDLCVLMKYTDDMGVEKEQPVS